MACVAADGSLTESGRRIVTTLAEAASAEEVARATALPLYRVRAALRELEAAGRVVARGDRFLAVPEPAAPH